MNATNSIAACARPACAKGLSDVKSKERPILFSAPMVRALLDGGKTQTRRVIKRPLQNPGWTEYVYFGPSKNNPTCKSRAIECGPDYPDGAEDQVLCPYGQPGDRLWVRETWQGPLLVEGDEFEAYRENPDDFKNPAYCEYAADSGPKPEFMTDDDELVCRWRPSIHMPRWASRIMLEITSVRVEQLQNISQADALAEGIQITCDAETKQSLVRITGAYPPAKYIKAHSLVVAEYASLWESINGPDAWVANPWVWVIEFRSVK